MTWQSATNKPSSINFNIVSKSKGSDRMSNYINEAANEIAEVMRTTLDTKAKL